MAETKEKALLRKIRKICEEHPDEVIKALLETSFWPRNLEPKIGYSRFDDDTRLGNIVVYFGSDGDGWIEVVSNKDPEEPFCTHRFRMPMIGGGQSPRVFTALRILAVAIDLDNEENPQNRSNTSP